jgi:hypothetical protein
MESRVAKEVRRKGGAEEREVRGIYHPLILMQDARKLN